MPFHPLEIPPLHLMMINMALGRWLSRWWSCDLMEMTVMIKSKWGHSANHGESVKSGAWRTPPLDFIQSNCDILFGRTRCWDSSLYCNIKFLWPKYYLFAFKCWNNSGIGAYGPVFDDASGLTLVERLKADQDKSTLDTALEGETLGWPWWWNTQARAVIAGSSL